MLFFAQLATAGETFGIAVKPTATSSQDNIKTKSNIRVITNEAEYAELVKERERASQPSSVSAARSSKSALDKTTPQTLKK